MCFLPLITWLSACFLPHSANIQSQGVETKLPISENANAQASQSLRLIGILIQNNKHALCPRCSGHHGYTSSGMGLNADTSQTQRGASFFFLDVFELACVFLACQCGTSVIVTCGPCGGQTDRQVMIKEAVSCVSCWAQREKYICTAGASSFSWAQLASNAHTYTHTSTNFESF